MLKALSISLAIGFMSHVYPMNGDAQSLNSTASTSNNLKSFSTRQRANELEGTSQDQSTQSLSSEAQKIMPGAKLNVRHGLAVLALAVGAYYAVPAINKYFGGFQVRSLWPKLISLGALGGTVITGLFCGKTAQPKPSGETGSPRKQLFENQTELNEAFIQAAKRVAYKEINQLLDLGAEINYQDKNGMTALHHIALAQEDILGSLVSFELVMMNGPDKTIRDKLGNTVYDYARTRATPLGIKGDFAKQI